jgi:glycosyltransferase involved in cell wall biosynthesis
VRSVSSSPSVVTHEAPDVIWVFRRSRRQWLREWEQGQRSSEFFYGLLSLRDRYRVGFVEDESPDPRRRAWYPVERLLARRMGMGFALDLALGRLRALNRARVVVSTNDACGLPLALLKAGGLLRSVLVYVSQGLSDRVATYGRDRALSRWYRRLLLGVDELATLSDGAAAGLADWLGLPRTRVHVLPFGTDHAFWRPTEPAGAGDYVISVGSDPGRDYPTLLAASDDLPLHIVTRQPLALAGRPRVVHTSDHSPTELRDLYSRARLAVFPLLDRDQPGGQSAALQAMACARAVVLTRTRGWWGESFLRDGQNCVLVPPGDVEALRRAMGALWAAPARCAEIGNGARDTVVAHFGEARFAAALGDVLAAHVPAVSATVVSGR